MMDCTMCRFRTERTNIKKGKIEFLDKAQERKIETNKGKFCRLGFMQNPKTKEAIESALNNGAYLCEHIRTST